MRKNILVLLISLLAISVLFTGCSSNDSKANLNVEADLNTATTPVVDVVDSTFDSTVIDTTTADVEIGSLI